MDKIRFGIVGIGGMGSHHANYMNSLEGAGLAALCDTDKAKLDAKVAQYNVPGFDDAQKLIDSKSVDAILIATPHYFHGPIARAAFAKGIHVLSEKPASVSVTDARQTNDAAAKYPQLKYGIMFNQRTNPMYQKMRELIADGELGEITRVTWLITDWFRSWSYYASGGWRATWAGEGGGVLINQCPHNLDLIQWITGIMPSRITAVGFVGKTHPIEVEDEISAILEYPNGAIGHFVTTTGEAPGTNRLEICGDRGKMVAEHGKLTFRRTRKGVRDIRENTPASFPSVECWDIDLAHRGGGDSHKGITQNFVRAILKDEPMIAPGVEGVKGLELGNAMLMAGLTRKPVELPIDGAAFDQFILDMTKQYGGRKTLKTREAKVDMGASFAKA